MSLATLYTASGPHSLCLSLANTFLSRLCGLVTHSALEKNDAFLIPHCASIHTCFMRFSIDVVYLDSTGRVIRCESDIKPWRASLCSSAVHILELAEGGIERLHIQPGDRLSHPYFQVAKTCTGLYRTSFFKQRGSAMLEFALAGPLITLIGLATLQYGLLFFAKNQINHAAFMAARAGSMDHASLSTMTQTYIKALIPLYGGGTSSTELSDAYTKAMADVSGHTQIELLNPTQESFDDWSDPALQARLNTSHRVIPFASQEFKDAGDIRPTSGQNIFDANILKIRITHGYLPKVPLMRSIYTTFLNWYDPHTDAFQTKLMQEGRIPVVTSLTIHMQSEAIESDNPISTPGMGNNGTPSDPGSPPASNVLPPNCTTLGCSVENPSPTPTPSLMSPLDPGNNAGACDPAVSCCAQ